MKKWLIPGFVLALAGISLMCGAQGAAPQAPAFELYDTKGQALSLDQFKGQVLVLNFWATWCPPCRAEIPDFASVYDEYKDKGLAMIGVSLDNMTEEDLGPYIEELAITYPVALGTEKMVDDYKPGRYIPATIVIDKKGRIRTRHTGVMGREILERLVLEYIKE